MERLLHLKTLNDFHSSKLPIYLLLLLLLLNNNYDLHNYMI